VHDLDVAVRLEQVAQAFRHHFVIVGDEDANAHGRRGTLTVMRVPLPFPDLASNVPPRASLRSRIVMKPNPPFSAPSSFGSNPTPSSSMFNSTSWPVARNSMVTCRAC